MFFPKLLDEVSSEEMVKRISSFGNKFGFVGNQGNDDRRRHKYDVWIASQVKRALSLQTINPLELELELFSILDWAIETKPNLSAINFPEALQLQESWLINLKKKGIFRSPPFDDNRVIYRCSSGRFLYILTSDDLDYEGYAMGNCVGGDNYKNNLKNHRCIIISLRDENNKPHVTIEITIMHDGSGKLIGVVKQQLGKENTEPKEKYHKDLMEFSLFSIGVGQDISGSMLTPK